MSTIKIFLTSLKEAISLDYARKYSSIKRNPVVKQHMDEFINSIKKLDGASTSKRGDRIYVPMSALKDFFGESTDNILPPESKQIKNDIESFINTIHYYNNDGEDVIFDFNYSKGTITIDKREFKIIKYLNRIFEIYKKNPNESKTSKNYNEQVFQKIIQRYTSDPNRSTQNFLVFSTHPYDIAGMTSGRKWSSCMNLESGENRSYVSCDVRGGTIICYFISIKDKNIQKPQGRVLFKPFVDIDDSSNVLYYPTGVYGDLPKQKFQDNLVKLSLFLQDEKEGEFKLKNSLYSDGYSETIEKFKNMEERIKIKIMKKIKPIDKGSYYLSEGNVNLSGMNLKTLKFFDKPWIVGGNFFCSHNQLTTLEGAPQEVGEGFYCYNNKLQTLEGAPQEVGGNFHCYNNQLTTLEGAPQKVRGDFYCYNNKLQTLKDAPQEVGGDFFCSNNKLTTLEGAPQEVGGFFGCSNNPSLSQEEIDRYLRSIGKK